MQNPHHYQDRVNRVVDYIARLGCFSPFHFHRIFQAVTGETLHSHVRRVRLERAAQLLRANPRRRITDVALATGFAGTAEFSRAFRNHFGHAASAWDRRSPLEKSKIGKDPEARPFYPVEELEQWKRAHRVRVRVRDSGPFRYAYQRLYAPYDPPRLIAAYQSLLGWLASAGIDTRDVVIASMSLDDPSISVPGKSYYDLGAAFPSGPGLLAGILRARGRTAVPPPSSGLSFRDFPSHPLASIHLTGDLGHVDRAWHYLYRLWLPESRYEPLDLPAMELFVRLPEEIGWQTFDLTTCIPVAPL